MNKSVIQADTLENVIRLETTEPLKINLVDEKGKSLKLMPEEKEGDKDKKLTDHLAKVWSNIPYRIALVILGLLIAIALVVWIKYPQTTVSELGHSPVGVDFEIKYCPWLTFRDENPVEITLVNRKTIPLRKVKAYLIFSDTLPIRSVAGGSNTTSFGDLARGECKTRIIKLVLPKRTSNRAEAILQIEAEGGIPKTDLKPLSFTIPPIPYLKLTFRKLLPGSILALASSVLGWLVNGILKEMSPRE